jgi:hypothetical protein
MTYGASESNERQADYVTLQVHTHTAGAKSDKRCLMVICTVHKQGRRDSVSSPGNTAHQKMFKTS